MPHTTKRKYATRGVVRLRQMGSEDRGAMGFSLPMSIARRIAHLQGTEFKATLTDEGILFTPYDERVANDEEAVPTWAKAKIKTNGRRKR